MTARYGRQPSYWDDLAKAKGSGSAYRREAPGVVPVGRSAVERERRDLTRALQLVPGAGRVLGAVVELLDAVARTVSRTDSGELMATAARRAGGLLLDVARVAEVPVVFPDGPVHDDADLDRKGSMQLMREDRESADRAQLHTARPLRRGVERAAAQQEREEVHHDKAE